MTSISTIDELSNWGKLITPKNKKMLNILSIKTWNVKQDKWWVVVTPTWWHPAKRVHIPEHQWKTKSTVPILLCNCWYSGLVCCKANIINTRHNITNDSFLPKATSYDLRGHKYELKKRLWKKNQQRQIVLWICGILCLLYWHVHRHVNCFKGRSHSYWGSSHYLLDQDVFTRKRSARSHGHWGLPKYEGCSSMLQGHKIANWFPGLWTIRFQNYSFPGTNCLSNDHLFARRFVPWTVRTKLLGLENACRNKLTK